MVKFLLMSIGQKAYSIKEEEENIVKVIPDIYQQEFTKNKLLNKKKFEISFDSCEKILNHIDLSFEERRTDLKVETSGIVLSYYLFNNLKVDLVIPSYNPTPSENSCIYSSYFLRTKPFYFNYKKNNKNFINVYKQQIEEKKIY